MLWALVKPSDPATNRWLRGAILLSALIVNVPAPSCSGRTSILIPLPWRSPMNTQISISLTLVDAPHTLPDLPSGVHHIAEIMPTVLASHGLNADSEQPTAASMATHFDLMIAALESALASGNTNRAALVHPPSTHFRRRISLVWPSAKRDLRFWRLVSTTGQEVG